MAAAADRIAVEMAGSIASIGQPSALPPVDPVATTPFETQRYGGTRGAGGGGGYSRSPDKTEEVWRRNQRREAARKLHAERQRS